MLKTFFFFNLIKFTDTRKISSVAIFVLKKWLEIMFFFKQISYKPWMFKVMKFWFVTGHKKKIYFDILLMKIRALFFMFPFKQGFVVFFSSSPLYFSILFCGAQDQLREWDAIAHLKLLIRRTSATRAKLLPVHFLCYYRYWNFQVLRTYTQHPVWIVLWIHFFV